MFLKNEENIRMTTATYDPFILVKVLQARSILKWLHTVFWLIMEVIQVVIKYFELYLKGAKN